MDSSRHKSEELDDIFENLGEPVECVQHYVPNGLNPTYLGDTVGKERYKILRKLGYGSYSTVWLAQDLTENGSLVALKIMRADSDCTNEIKCYDRLRSNANQHPGSAFIMMLTDHFSVQGPNGNHDYLAYEVLGPSIPQVLQESAGLDTTAYLTLPCARKAVYQVLLGLDYMHSVGLVHGDIYAANVLFAVKDLTQQPTDHLYQPCDQVTVDVKRLNGPQQPGDPRHLTLNWPLNNLISPNGDVKLSDLGNSFLENDPPKLPETPSEIRSPEMIFDHRISKAQDSWAFGCLVYYMLTNQLPIDLGFVYDKDARDDTHLIQLFSLLGPLPPRLKHSWPRYEEYFDDEGRPKKFEVDDEFLPDIDFEKQSDDDHRSMTPDSIQTLDKDARHRAGEVHSIAEPAHAKKPQERFNPQLYPSIVNLYERKTRKDEEVPKTLAEFTALNPPLRDRWMNEKHPDMQPEESELVLNLLQSLLMYDPDQRFSTKQLLQHAWIRNYCASGREHNESVEGAETAVAKKKRKRSISEGNHN